MGYGLGTITEWSLALSGKLVNLIMGRVFRSGNRTLILLLQMSFVRKRVYASRVTAPTCFGQQLLLFTITKCQSPHAIRTPASSGFPFAKPFLVFPHLPTS